MAETPSGRNKVRAGRGDTPVTRAAVLSAALEIVDRVGIDGLSMRRLAEAVGRDPMVIYRHVPNKAAVIDGVAEVVFTELSVDAAASDWVAEVRRVAREFRRVALAHPRVVPLLVTRPLATPLGQRPPAVVRLLEDMLALLMQAGYTEVDALHIYRALFGFLHGHVLNELQELVERPDETDDLLRLGLYRLPIGEFPRVRNLASVLASYNGAVELERGLDILLAGLAATLPGPGNGTRPGSGDAVLPGPGDAPDPR
ncbi:TetR/AcrR family transcriptional regulator C-terminal domain-containing protein [Nocardia sp. N2S4-5]|uniref:TetR/AcrR family transcriptional regulator C-terminal domain-containing protein n=1 Tax=Nocardia sp. N2S4-5 TaxID=3351565 RepID=UPI0037D0AB7D